MLWLIHERGLCLVIYAFLFLFFFQITKQFTISLLLQILLQPVHREGSILFLVAILLQLVTSQVAVSLIRHVAHPKCPQFRQLRAQVILLSQFVVMASVMNRATTK